jgi:hypothetical protein
VLPRAFRGPPSPLPPAAHSIAPPLTQPRCRPQQWQQGGSGFQDRMLPGDWTCAAILPPGNGSSSHMRLIPAPACATTTRRARFASAAGPRNILRRRRRRRQLTASSPIDSSRLAVVQASNPIGSKERHAHSRERPRPFPTPERNNTFFSTVISNYSDRMMGRMLMIIIAASFTHTPQHAESRVSSRGPVVQCNPP